MLINLHWYQIADVMPNDGVTVLTRHIDDLYPVAAFWASTPEGVVWLRETEGPEDIQISGRHGDLYRPPTHWAKL